LQKEATKDDTKESGSVKDKVKSIAKKAAEDEAGTSDDNCRDHP